jgi:hypothetical protein
MVHEETLVTIATQQSTNSHKQTVQVQVTPTVTPSVYAQPSKIGCGSGNSSASIDGKDNDAGNRWPLEPV